MNLLIDSDGGTSLLMQDDEGNTPLHKVWSDMLLYIHVVSDMYTCYIVHVYILDSLRIRVHVFMYA